MEYIDLLDADGRPAGRTVPRAHRLQSGEYMLAVHIFIYRADGLFLLQKRARSKRMYPGRWDVTGGGVQAGEASLDAALRETREEVGLTLPRGSMRRITQLKRPPIFFDVWACRHEFAVGDVVMQPDEVEDIRMVPPNDMLRILFEENFPDPGYRAAVAAFLQSAAFEARCTE